MKAHFRNSLVILIVSVAAGVSGSPPVANSATATAETTAGVFIPNAVPLPVFGPPPCCWQNLPFKAAIPAAAGLLSSNATPAELALSLEKEDLARIQRFVREGGLRPARQPERRLESLTQSFQPNVSVSGDQINILKTFLQ
jgi:hypothetical protein